MKPHAAIIESIRATIADAYKAPFYGYDVFPIMTTNIDRTTCLEAADAEFDTLAEQMPDIQQLRVDTYTLKSHPVPGSDIRFDLYVKVIIVGRTKGAER